MPAFERVRERSVLRSASELDNADFFRSALYNEIWKPQGLYYRVEVVIHGSRCQPLGSLVLYRAPGDTIFGKDEEALLGALVPYIARALEREVALPLDFARRHGHRALLSMSNEGDLQYISQDAHRMLLLAHGGITPDAAGRVPRRETSPTLGILVEQIRRSQGQSFHRASVTIENVWGRFVFEAERLVPLDPTAPSAIHVTIQHDEPRAVAQRRVLGALPLSVTQREVCALLHAGYTHAAIGTLLLVTPSTVADHIKKIYTKLDVHSVHELRSMLDSMGAHGASR
jgi:DNA-binding CsgD family transcriptional regulator